MADQVYVKSGKSFRYQAIIENVVGRGSYGRVFAGHFKPNLNSSWGEQSDEEKQAAIKRVEIDFKEENIKNDREFVALKKLRHPCIVRLFAVEDDDNFRNYIFELCQATLEDFITKKYDGLNMPDEIEGLYQMACGLQFIHERNMIHRDIKPENILISVLDDGSARLKIADLGFTKPLKEDGIHYDLASGLKGTRYYMAPELLALKNSTGRVLDKECTIATDVFAAGCTFFRYLNGGLHPFGKGFDIELNIVDGNPINATKYEGEPWKTDFMVGMVQFNPIERPSFSTIVEVLEIHNATISRSSFPPMSGEEFLSPVIVEHDNVDDVQIDWSNEIGSGRYATVFTGTFRGEKVAIKRVELMKIDDRKIIKIQQLLNHSNIVQFKHFEKDGVFGHIVMELCTASLSDFIEEKYQGPMPTDEQVLFQLANGLEYIHSMGILHRDIKPENILISSTKPVQMKYSDFGLSKPVNEKGSCSLNGIRGTQNWMSPEEICEEMDGRGSVKSDIFSAGCVFIYFLLRGKHPFGKPFDIITNISNGSPLLVKEFSEEHFARPFVLQMIANDPEKRISLQGVIDQLKPLQPAIRLSLLQYDNQNLLCSTGTSSRVYHVGTLEESPLAVKRILRENCTTKSFEEMKRLDHLNIIRFLHFDQDDLYKYFGMELCVASLDQLFLPEDDPKKYNGLIPSDEQFCFQFISGLEYIHGKYLVHGSIKPTNILISSRKDPQIKLSDFGLTTSRMDEGHTTKRLISGFLSSRYWLAPELLLSESSDRQCTKESDIFAAGSVFFYFLSKGCHLFGDPTHEIIKNTREGNQFNLFKKMTIGHFAMGLIRWMTQKDPYKRPELSVLYTHLELVQPMKTENLRVVGTIQFSRAHFLDRGGLGSVYLGRCERSTSDIVIKRMELIEGNRARNIDRELAALRNLCHPNIVKFFDSASDLDYINIAIEKCLTSLDKYCRQPLLYHGVIPMPTDQQVLLQMAEGLHYIHSQKIVNESQPLIHRDVNPTNILISCDNPAVIKWAGFGLSRNVVSGSNSFTWSQLKGTERWLAPELIQSDVKAKVRGSQSCDVFALGCVFFFFLTQGMHPFGDGDKYIVQYNITIGNQVNLNQLSKEHFAFSTIEKMIQNDPHSRPKMSAVVLALQLGKMEYKSVAYKYRNSAAKCRIRPLFRFVLHMIKNDPEKRISLSEVIDQLEPLQPTNRLSLLQYDSKNLLCSTGTSSLVFHVGTFGGSPLAVKRVLQDNCTTKSFEELKQINHPNIIRLLHFDQDDFYKYFGMELCMASLDQLFLPEGDPKKYKGPNFPSDEEFCFQLISGLEYIHGENIVHKSIKPTNILISSSQDPQIKLSDFGLTTSCLNEGHTTKPVISGFLSSRYWLAPELLECDSADGQSTKESDIFSAGSVFFYFLSKGCHLFGNATHEILKNTCEGNQFNLFEKMTIGHFAMGLIRWMTQKDPYKRPELSKDSVLYAHFKSVQPMKKLETVGTIQFSREHFLDRGRYGRVYLGRSNGVEVVIKRMELIEGNRKGVIHRELAALRNLCHPNIVQFFDSASDLDYIHIAIEKCLTSLDKYCRQPLLYHGVIPMPTDQQVLLQMAKGLHYIHSQKIVNNSQSLIHRDVKPENILISCDNPAVIKWADFGLARNVVTGSRSFTWSQLKGSDRWLAPELIQSDVQTKVKGSQRCDVFALGCVFFFFLTQGIHPFGDGERSSVKKNIRKGKQVNLNQLSTEHFAFSIIEKMIQNDPRSRPKMSAVVDALQLPATPVAFLENSWNENISQLQNLDLGN